MAAEGDVLRANLRGNYDSSDVWNMVFHYSVTAGSSSDYNAIATDIEAQFATAFALVNDDLGDHTQTDDMDLSEYDFVDHEFDGKATIASSALLGTDPAQGNPNGIACVLRFITEELRRQARKFVPGVTEVDIDENSLSASLIVSLALCAAVLNNNFTADGLSLHPCTFNTTLLSARYETLSLFTQTAFVNTFVGYQRGRQPGAGA